MVAQLGPLVGRASELARFSEDGFGRRVLAETERLRVVVAALEEGQEIPVHAPAADLVMAIMEGMGRVMAGAEARPVRAGDVVVVPAGERRGLRAEGGRLVALNVVSPPPGDADHARGRAEWPPEAQAPDVGGLILEEHGGLLPKVEELGTLAAEAETLDEAALRRGLDSAVEFLDHALLPHAEEEERSVYPAAEGVLRAVGGGTRTMSIDHRFIAEMASELGEVARGPLTGERRQRAQRLLHGLRTLLEVHLTKENEVYVPLLRRLPPGDRVALYEHLTGGDDHTDHRREET